MGKDGACGGVAATKAHMEKRNECLNWSGLAEGDGWLSIFMCVLMNKFTAACFSVAGRLSYQHKHPRVKKNCRGRRWHGKAGGRRALQAPWSRTCWISGVWNKSTRLRS